ncbi:MAG TPA: hypothetical protein GX506_11030 [Firmicutes bacterium]|nr:hypothetical protein [Bacillota bacterium]
MERASRSGVGFWVVILLACVGAGILGFRFWQGKVLIKESGGVLAPARTPGREAGRTLEQESAIAPGQDVVQLFRRAAENTLAIKKAVVVDEVAFPSSDRLLSMSEAWGLGTGLWERTVEFTPGGLHYISSSEDSEFEGYRSGDRIIFRIRGPGTGTPGRWQEPDGELDEETGSEIQWMRSFKGMQSVFDDGLLDAGHARAVREEGLGGDECVVVQLEVPSIDAKFSGPASSDGETSDPVKYEILAWVTKGTRPIIRQMQDMYVYKSRESGLYEYSVGRKRIEERPRLEIKMPEG